MNALLRQRATFWVSLALVFVGLLLLLNVPDLTVEYLWMSALEHATIFWTIRLTQIGLFAAALVLVLAYFGANAYGLSRYVSTIPASVGPGGRLNLELGEIDVPIKQINYLLGGATLLASLLFAAAVAVRWSTVLEYMHAQSFGTTDPIFGLDVGFYVFHLPFLELVQNHTASLALVVTLVVSVFYAYTSGFRFDREAQSIHVHPYALKHIALNGALLALTWGAGYVLDRYGLLFEAGGLVYGVTYTDAVIRLPALWIMAAASAVLAAGLLLVIRNRNFMALGTGIAGYFALHVIALGVIPSAVQRFTVEPSELELERPYIENSIAMTRSAYELDEVQTQPYGTDPTDSLTAEILQEHETTIENIRLWDPRLLIETYRQIQEIRLYYQFYNVDVDRYTLNEQYRQVMLAARELTQTLPEQSRNWVNRHLQYTHGYGLTMNRVSQEGTEGVPRLIVQDLPPVAQRGLEIEQAAIYYGENTPGYNIVNTSIEEFDYPSGDENVYTHYQGEGGVLLDAYWKKLLFAYDQSDFNILLTEYITDESRIQFWNRLEERVRRVAPFLRLDEDPYLVLSEGRLKWVVDAYTSTPGYPYAEPASDGSLNYIRNSVKIVVDAYHGSVTFYAMEEDDPLLDAYREAFPGTFRPLEEMPDALRDNLRYPEDLFSIQLQKYNKYHMTRPQVFYNSEDLWTLPREQYGGNQVTMEPYYLLMELPEEEELQFLLMSPLTPQNRDNMIAWMAAKSDFPDYGELVVYTLPKERLFYGPDQVESMIDQDTEISQQLALWDQRGSRVIRGNLLSIPIQNDFLFVEPVFLIAQGIQIPQLQRVIVAHGDRIEMAPTLEGAIRQVFGLAEPPPVVAAPEAPTDTTVASPVSRQPAQQLAQQALDRLDQADQALRDGQWSEFGTALQNLRDLLEQPDDQGATTQP